MSKDIFIFAEQRDNCLQKVALELLGKAIELKKAKNDVSKVIAVLLCGNAGDMPKTLCYFGADSVIVAEDKRLSEYSTEPYAKTITEIIKEKQPEIMLYGATSIGRDLAPRVSARITTGLTADCTSLEIDEETGLLLMTRPAFGGNVMATIVCAEKRPQMATVRPGVMKAAVLDVSRPVISERFDVKLSESDMNVKIVSVEKSEVKTVDIIDAKRLVSGGRGIGSKDGFSMLYNLSHALDNAEVAASRAAVDAGWVPSELQVGQTGKTVRPELYIACGISGAIQHLAGMEDSDYIIAINKDPDAAIFGSADLGIVGDVNVIIPKLTEAIKKYKATK